MLNRLRRFRLLTANSPPRMLITYFLHVNMTLFGQPNGPIQKSPALLTVSCKPTNNLSCCEPHLLPPFFNTQYACVFGPIFLARPRAVRKLPNSSSQFACASIQELRVLLKGRPHRKCHQYSLRLRPFFSK